MKKSQIKTCQFGSTKWFFALAFVVMMLLSVTGESHWQGYKHLPFDWTWVALRKREVSQICFSCVGLEKDK
jgi:hypothetical protein